VVTPNGDGINDEALVDFTVLRVTDGSPVEMQLYDVTGRPVRRILEQRSRGAGLYEMGWDGRDDGGDLVPPGVYVARIRIRTDTDGTSLQNREILRTLSVVY
jgi:flagellar hook assembly protein FlgD